MVKVHDVNNLNHDIDNYELVEHKIEDCFADGRTDWTDEAYVDGVVRASVEFRRSLLFDFDRFYSSVFLVSVLCVIP